MRYLLLLCFGYLVNAQAEWPERYVQIYVPGIVGSSSDAGARVIADALSKELNVSFVVSNRQASAGNVVGTNEIAKAKPDGYVLGVVGSGPIGIAPYLYRTMPYDVEKDLEYIFSIGMPAHVYATRPDFPANNLQELFAYIKANPGKLNWGTPGQRNIPHALGAGLFNPIGETVHVPYKSAPQGIVDVLEGRIHIFIEDVSVLSGHLRANKLKILAVDGRTMKSYPQVEEVSRYSTAFDPNGAGWLVLIGPAGIPQSILHKMNSTLNRLAKGPLGERLNAMELTYTGGTLQETRNLFLQKRASLERLSNLANFDKRD